MCSVQLMRTVLGPSLLNAVWAKPTFNTATKDCDFGERDCISLPSSSDVILFAGGKGGGMWVCEHDKAHVVKAEDWRTWRENVDEKLRPGGIFTCGTPQTTSGKISGGKCRFDADDDSSSPCLPLPADAKQINYYDNPPFRYYCTKDAAVRRESGRGRDFEQTVLNAKKAKLVQTKGSQVKCGE